MHEGFADSVTPVRAIYSLDTANADAVSIKHLAGFAKLTEVRANIYRPRFVEAMGLRERNVALCAGLAATSPVARITRPRLGFTLDAVIDCILEDLGEPD